MFNAIEFIEHIRTAQQQYFEETGYELEVMFLLNGSGESKPFVVNRVPIPPDVVKH